jgi:hypothetical protein
VQIRSDELGARKVVGLGEPHHGPTLGRPAHRGPASGLVAYVDDEPAGWVAVEPRTAYPKLRTSRVPWSGRDEDKGDDGIWAVTCFVVRKGYRGRGLTYPLARVDRLRVMLKR